VSAEEVDRGRDLRLPSSGATPLNINAHKSAPTRLRKTDVGKEVESDRLVTVAGQPTIVVEALAAALDSRAGLTACSAHHVGPDLMRLVANEQPQVLVLFLARLDASSIETVEDLKAAAPGTRLVIVTPQPDIGFLAKAAVSGVAACLSLDICLDDLIAAIRAETTRTMLVGASTLSLTRPSCRVRKPGNEATGLTARELEVLTLLSEGCSAPAIAARLVVSIHTARGHVKNVLRKLGAHSQLEAVATAARAGLLRRVPADRTAPDPADRAGAAGAGERGPSRGGPR
jgi:DNA-binding NarL/FixJ family response regulator